MKINQKLPKKRYDPLNGTKLSVDDDEYWERISSLEGHIVYHAKYMVASERLHEVHKSSRKTKKPDLVFFYGDTGLGKTTLAEEFTEKYKAYDKEKSGAIVRITPVLKVTVPERPRTPKPLAQEILNKFGDPLYSTGDATVMKSRIKHFVTECETEMIIIDEFQHLIDRDTEHVLAAASDWLKTLVDELNIPVTLFGKPEAKRIFEFNSQLDGRYRTKIQLPSFTFDNPKTQGDFRKFLASMDFGIPLSGWSNLQSLYLSAKLYYASKGVPRYVKNILLEATKLAMKKGLDQLDEDLLQVAFDMLTLETRPHARNPFNNSDYNFAVWIKDEEEITKLAQKEQEKNKKMRRRR